MPADQATPEAKMKHNRTWIEDCVSALCLIFCVAAFLFSSYGAGPAWIGKLTAIQFANGDGTYSAGLDDAYGVFFLAASLVALRKVTQEVVFGPLADFLQIKKDKIKFKQNGWVLIYYASSFTWGLILLRKSSYWFDGPALAQNYPQNASMSLNFKLYLGFQMAFWAHMMFVTLVEPWQNDFPVMIAHHIITIIMFVGSYYLSFVYYAHAILVCQDFADIFLPLAKLFNYAALGESRFNWFYQMIADTVFAIFALAWIPTRHVLLPCIYYHLWNSEPVFQASECACGQGTACVYAPERGCTLSSETMLWGFVIPFRWFLGFLQVLLAFWLKELLMAIYRVIVGGGSTKGVEEASVSFTPELDVAESTKKKA